MEFKICNETNEVKKLQNNLEVILTPFSWVLKKKR